MQLNDQQLKIVNTPGGKIAVIAGAGAGKSSTTIELVKKLYEKDKIPLERIFISTFTNKAGDDIKKKLQKKFNFEQNYLKNLWIGTLHSLGYRYLKDIQKLKLNIITPPEANVLLKNISELTIGDSEIDFKEILENIDKKRNKNCTWEEASLHPKLCKLVFEKYQKEKIKQNLADFGDLIEKFAEYLEEDIHFKKRFDWVILDEVQDVCKIMYRISDLIARDNCLYVGDIKQAIYGFRGACPHLFQEKINNSEIVYPLAYNYRSSSKILDFANAILKQMPQFKDQDLLATGSIGEKPIFTMCSNQAEEVFKNIQKDIAKGIPYKEIAVLSRSVKYGFIGDLEVLLRKAKIPYIVWGGNDKLEISYVQDFLSILKVLSSPTSVSLLNAFSLLPKIGAKIAQNLTDVVMSHGFDQLKYVTASYTNTKEFKDFLKLKEFKGSNNDTLFKALDFYENNYLKAKYKEDASDKRDFIYDLLFKTLSEHSDLNEGINNLYLNTEDDETDKNRVVISTVHKAKGLEWESVHVTQCIEFSIPFIKQEEEGDETRLGEEFCIFYVACTRAKNHLKMYMPYRSQRGQYNFVNKLSRYIRNLYNSSKEQFFTLKCLDVPSEERFKEDVFENRGPLNKIY